MQDLEALQVQAHPLQVEAMVATSPEISVSDTLRIIPV